jgi:hypothetical protein
VGFEGLGKGSLELGRNPAIASMKPTQFTVLTMASVSARKMVPVVNSIVISPW